MLRRGEASLADHAILGLFLGLAMLAKFSALIPLVLCTGVLLVQRWLASRRSASARRWRGSRRPWPSRSRCVAGTTLRVALRFGGNPFVGNWDAASGQAWWQDPGYHVLGDYLRFGLTLERPLMSAVAGVPDALYSTFWGDGMLSGVGGVEDADAMEPPAGWRRATCSRSARAWRCCSARSSPSSISYASPAPSASCCWRCSVRPSMRC